MSETTQGKGARTAKDGLDTQPADRIVTGAERRIAVETWLLTAADDRDKARHEWHADGIALLRCGGVFTAVRVPLVLVEAAADATDRRRMGAYLDEALLGGAVFIDETSCHVCFLVPPTLWNRWKVPDTECLSSDSYLGVPHPNAEPWARSHWLLDMGGPGDLCTPDAVRQLVDVARFRLAQNGG